MLQLGCLALTLLPFASLLCILGTKGLLVASGLHILLLGVCSSSLCLRLQHILLAFLCQYLQCTHSMFLSGKCANFTAKAPTSVCLTWFILVLSTASMRHPFFARRSKKERSSSVSKTRLLQKLRPELRLRRTHFTKRLYAATCNPMTDIAVFLVPHKVLLLHNHESCLAHFFRTV